MKMLEVNFWQDKSESQKIIKEKKLYEDLISSHEKSTKELIELGDLYELATEENNQLIIKEILKNIEDLKVKTKKMKLNVFFQMKVIV